MLNTRKMRYTPHALAAFKASNIHAEEKHICTLCNGKDVACQNNGNSFSNRVWAHIEHNVPPTPEPSDRNIGEYPFTSELASWVRNAMENFQPDDELFNFVKPFSQKFHEALDAERKNSSGLHNLQLVELTYQVTLEVAAAVILAADATSDPISLTDETHSSRAGGDEEFAPWGLLLTGLECDPPILGLFPFYLMMCQAFTFEPASAQEHYVYAALTGIDWARAGGKFSKKMGLFEKRARAAVPKLDDKASGQDRSFWRIAHAYLAAINAFENSRPFKTPRRAAIRHHIDLDLIIAMRGLDTIGSAYMCSDGAAWLDEAGVDSLVGSAVPNDIMDLHTDIKTGETRNLLRLLYPDGLGIEQTKIIASTVLSGLLSELYRGHHRARFGHREDGRIVATSPPYSFCRAQHRRVFETLEMYMDKYQEFWGWTWEIFQMAKDQVTEEGLKEPLVCSLKRAGRMEPLPSSPLTSFYDSYYELVEIPEPLQAKRPLGVSNNISHLICELHNLWNIELREPNKEPGWGRRFDIRSDKLFGDIGRILSNNTDSDELYKFAIAYGRLSVALPYITYHTVDAIIMAFGTI